MAHIWLTEHMRCYGQRTNLKILATPTWNKFLGKDLKDLDFPFFVSSNNQGNPSVASFQGAISVGYDLNVENEWG